jgi:phosphate-selective porin OprO and OprP
VRRLRTTGGARRVVSAVFLWLALCSSWSARADDGNAADDDGVHEESGRPLTRKQKRAKRLRLVDDLEVLPGAMARSTGIPKGRGYWVGTPDRQYILRLSGFAHFDQRSAWALGSGDGDSTRVFMRRARAALEGTVLGNLDYRFLFDAAIGLAPIDAYIDYRAMPEVNLRVGKFKSPFGFERRARAFALIFNERGLPTRLAPNRDFGVFVHGQTRDGFFSYDVAMLGGSIDHESINFFRGTPDFAARVYVQPFRLSSSHDRLRHLGVGFSTTAGDERGDLNDSRLASINTPFGSRFFGYRSAGNSEDAFADGLRFRWSLHGHYRYQRLNTMFEFVESQQRVRAGEEVDSLSHRAWMAYVSLALTDDENEFFGINPSRPFAPKKGQYGGFSLGIRYHELYLDERSFPYFADPNASARRARSGTLSFQWYLNLYLEMQVDLEYVKYQGGAPFGGDRDDELAIFGRLETRF